MKRHLRRGILIALFMCMVATPVLAGVYKSFILVESSGVSYTPLAINMTMDIDYLVANGFIHATGRDTRITDGTGRVLPHLLANDKVLWVANIPANSKTEFVMWTGQSLIGSLPVICGHGGYVTVPDNSVLEPGGVFAFGIVGYVDTAAGADKNIIRKDGAVTFNVTANEQLTFAITGGNSLVASNVTSGVYTIMIYSDGFELWMEINDVEKDRKVASSVPNTSNNWTLFENNVMPYVYYYGMWVVP